MGGHTLADPGPLPRCATGRLKSAAADTGPGLPAGKQPQAWPRPLPISPKDLQKTRRQHRIAIFAALGALDVEQHPSTVDRGDLQAYHLADTKARRISRRQRNTIA